MVYWTTAPDSSLWVDVPTWEISAENRVDGVPSHPLCRGLLRLRRRRSLLLFSLKLAPQAFPHLSLSRNAVKPLTLEPSLAHESPLPSEQLAQATARGWGGARVGFVQVVSE